MITLQFTNEEIATLLSVDLIRQRIIELAEIGSNTSSAKRLRLQTFPFLGQVVTAKQMDLIIQVGESYASYASPSSRVSSSFNRIAAIKKARELMPWGLKEAKDFVEQVAMPEWEQRRPATGVVVPDEEET